MSSLVASRSEVAWPGEIDPEPEGFGAVTTTTI